MNKDEIRCMFNKISNDYDFLNNLISLFLHKFIKGQAIKSLNIKADAKVLDICTGSGDLAFIIKKNCTNCTIFAIDFSDEMLTIAKKKYPDIIFLKMDALKLDFDDESFDYIVMGFGFRNIIDKNLALAEIKRVLKKGGSFLHLDFGEKNFASKISDFLILIAARLFSKNFDAYKYLIKSKETFYTPNELIDYISQYGFKCILRKDFLFKVISCQIFTKY